MSDVRPPAAARVPTDRVRHGDIFVDEYEWLRDADAPETLAYLEAENAYTEARTAHLAGLREAIFEEIRSHTLETDLSVPSRIGDWWYYGRTHEDKQYGSSCRCPVRGSDDWTPPVLDAEVEIPGEQVLLDADELAEGHDFFSLGGVAVSPDGRLLAFSTDVIGNERYLLRVKDLRTGDLLPDEVPDTMGGAVWDRRGTTLFYVTPDAAWRPDKLWRHVLGTPVEDDVVVHHETDERFWTGVARSRSNRFLFRASGSKTTSEYAVLDADDPTGEFRVVAPRRDGVEYSLEHAVIAGEDRLLVLHNDGAVNYALASAPIDATSHEQWEPMLPHDPAIRLEDVDAFAGHLVVSQRSDGLTQLRILTLDEQGVDEDFLVEFEEEVRTVGAGGNPEFVQPTVRLGYVTLAEPSAVYDFEVADRKLTLLRRTPVLPAPDGTPFDRSRYVQSREWATAPDGTRVPISIVTPVDAPRDGSMPMVLYGYGSYETSIDPSFSVSRLSLLDRGIGFAIAHVRGGGELGRPWYDDGKMMNKRNTFTDFAACARHLAATGWTSADRLAAEGGSAGGLLMGVVANTDPDAFAAILAGVPFVDALTTILDPSLPLTVIEWEEWGNPVEDAEAYAYMKSYSPYENVIDQRYPAILAETSLHDTRVLYVEPAKWVAKLRATLSETADGAGGSDDILLRTRMSAGHGGVSGRHNTWRERAFGLAWIVDKIAPETAGVGPADLRTG